MAAARRPARGPRRAAPTSSASAGWSSPIPSCRPTCSPARPLKRKAICRTFSDCTTAPRNGLVSGCYPLDPFYASRPEAARAQAGERSAPGMRTDGRRPGTRPWPSPPPSWPSSRSSAVALYGLPFFYDFFVKDLGWTRAAGHVGQRPQQARGRPAVRLPRGHGRRPLRSAAADARGHPDGGRRARRPRRASRPWRPSTSSTASTPSATSAAARCPTRCCSRAGSTRAAARPWASPTWGSASAARSCRSSPTR